MPTNYILTANEEDAQRPSRLHIKEVENGFIIEADGKSYVFATLKRALKHIEDNFK